MSAGSRERRGQACTARAFLPGCALRARLTGLALQQYLSCPGDRLFPGSPAAGADRAEGAGRMWRSDALLCLAAAPFLRELRLPLSAGQGGCQGRGLVRARCSPQGGAQPGARSRRGRSVPLARRSRGFGPSLVPDRAPRRAGRRCRCRPLHDDTMSTDRPGSHPGLPAYVSGAGAQTCRAGPLAAACCSTAWPQFPFSQEPQRAGSWPWAGAAPLGRRVPLAQRGTRRDVPLPREDGLQGPARRIGR